MRDDEAFAVGVMVIVLGIFALIFLTMLIIYIFYLLSLSKCLKKVQPENRAMEPGLVWLSLIPVFSLVWNFFIVIQLKESLSNEFNSRRLPNDGDFGFGMGLTFAILTCVNNIPYLNLLTIIPTLIFWIIYWIKIVGYSKQLDDPFSAEDIEASEVPDSDFYR